MNHFLRITLGIKSSFMWLMKMKGNKQHQQPHWCVSLGEILSVSKIWQSKSCTGRSNCHLPSYPKEGFVGLISLPANIEAPVDSEKVR